MPARIPVVTLTRFRGDHAPRHSQECADIGVGKAIVRADIN